MTIDVLKTLRNDSKCNSNAQTVPVRRVSSVRRSLFGDVDHEKSMSFLKKELDAIAESQKKRWNFDFTNEKPLHDSCEYEWTPVQADEIVPKPYALSRLPYLYEHTENSPLSSDKSDSCLPTTQQSSRLQVQQVTMSKTKLKQTLIDGELKWKFFITISTYLSFISLYANRRTATLSNVDRRLREYSQRQR